MASRVACHPSNFATSTTAMCPRHRSLGVPDALQARHLDDVRIRVDEGYGGRLRGVEQEATVDDASS